MCQIKIRVYTHRFNSGGSQEPMERIKSKYKRTGVEPASPPTHKTNNK